MAATFPGSIEYSNASPSGRIAAVAAPQAPAGGLEAIGQGLQNLGQAFEKVQAQKDTTELSTMRRLFDESSYAHINKYSQLGNPEDRKKEAEAWAKEVEGIQSKSSRVNTEFQKYKDSKMPDVGQTFANHELGMQAKENKAAFAINSQAYLERGDMSEYIKGLHTAQATGIITEAERDYKITNAFTDSALAMARIDIGVGRYEQAQKQLEGLKGLNDTQLDQRDRLLADLHKVKDPQVEKDRVSIAEQIENGTATFQTIQATHLDQKEKDSYWTHAQEVTRQRAKGETIATDQDSRIAANEVVLAYKDGSVQRKDALAGIAKYQDKINPTEFKQITDDIYNYADNKDPIKQRMINEFNKNFMYLASKNKLADADRKTNILIAIEYQKTFSQWIKNNPDASDAEITDKYGELTKSINFFSFGMHDIPAEDLAEARRRTTELLPVTTLSVAPATTIKSDAEFNALPSGTTFIGPDGKRRIKP